MSVENTAEEERREERGVLEGFFVEFIPVCYAPVQTAGVDEVEAVFAVDPVVAAVVDFKMEVWWDPGGLDGGKICSDYSRGRVCICKITVAVVNTALVEYGGGTDIAHMPVPVPMSRTCCVWISYLVGVG